MTFIDPYNENVILATIKTMLLLLTACSVHRSLSPPNPSVRTEECCSGTEGTDTLFERVVQSITYCSKCMVWFGVICDVSCIFLRQFLPLAFAIGMPFDGALKYIPLCGPESQKDTIPLTMIVGTALAVVSAVLRIWCFNSLGPFFTFEITIRPKHRLITHGPYAWVRHPSYTGVYLTLTGATLVLAAPGSWMREYAVKTAIGALVAFFWIVKCTFAFKGMVVRLKAEDRVLRDTFGVQWEEYATRVPKKFVPGIL